MKIPFFSSSLPRRLFHGTLCSFRAFRNRGKERQRGRKRGEEEKKRIKNGENGRNVRITWPVAKIRASIGFELRLRVDGIIERHPWNSKRPCQARIKREWASCEIIRSSGGCLKKKKGKGNRGGNAIGGDSTKVEGGKREIMRLIQPASI